MMWSVGNAESRPRRRASARSTEDLIEEAWTLVLADDGGADRPAHLRVYLDGHPGLPRLADAAARPGGPPVAWFEPDGQSVQPGADGRLREVHVEAAVLLGLPRWTDSALPSNTRGWSVRPVDVGLCLSDPTGQVFAVGVGEVPEGWTSAARSAPQVLAVYGVRPTRLAGLPSSPRRTPDEQLREAQRAGFVAAGLATFVGSPRR
ncbi:hypothetical protein [Micromonospora vulcania]|uniref:Uncharacterized protein n=1 Tax=Micromonospora vulcania TaxID=1441873 RepID=A0ABW1H2N4_9ACTN